MYFFTYKYIMPGKISNSAVYDTEEERRPVAVNMRQFRPKPIPIDKASLAMELLNNQTRPVVNIVGTRHFHEDPAPLDKNYPIEIELQRLAMQAVPNKPPFQPLKTKTPFTEDMIEKYREEERRGILQRGYDVPAEIENIDLTPNVIIPDAYKNYDETMRQMTESMVNTTLEYDRLKRNVPLVVKQLKELDDKYNNLMISPSPKQRVRMTGDKKTYLEDEYIQKKQNLETYLETLKTDMKNLQEEIQMTNTNMEQMKQDKKDLYAQDANIRRSNALKIKNAEDQIRLLNTSLPIQQMINEPDEVYRERLIALRVPVDNSRIDAQEARIYEHKIFKNNLKKLIDLPLYQVEGIIKSLDMNDAERTYQLNEIFPKVETEFIKVFGRKPLLRNPVESLVDFFMGILEAPLVAQEQSEAISALAEEQSLYTGDIDPSLRNLKKAEVLKLLKEAGITKGKAQEFQRKTVKQLKVIYTQHLKRNEAFEFLSQRGQEAQAGIQARNKAQLDQILRWEQEEDAMMRAEDKQVRQAEKEYKREEKAQKQIEQKEQANLKKGKTFIQQKMAEVEKAQKEQRKQEAEYMKLLEAQRKQAEKEAAKKEAAKKKSSKK